MKTAVVLLNLGGPDSLDAVRPFLQNLFSDPEILRFPLSGLLQKPLARLIAARRAPKVAEKYRQIGGRSPLGEITERQAEALERELGGAEGGFAVRVAMRYWHPRALSTARALREEAPDRILILPLYPQYSRATTGSSVRDLEVALAREGLGDVPSTVVASWHDFPPYVDALAEAIREGLAEVPGAAVLFSAHSLPVRLVEEGDPYLDQVKGTVAAVAALLTEGRRELAFQSRAGPVRWLEPAVPEMLRRLAAEGERDLVVVPVSFVSDHIETLHEIDVEYGELAREIGFRTFRRSPSLNTRPGFIRALAELVRTRSAG